MGLGFRSVSVAPSAIGPLKAMIRKTSLPEIEAAVGALMKGDRGAREKLKSLSEASDLS